MLSMSLAANLPSFTKSYTLLVQEEVQRLKFPLAKHPLIFCLKNRVVAFDDTPLNISLMMEIRCGMG